MEAGKAIDYLVSDMASIELNFINIFDIVVRNKIPFLM